jgi:hypothetical protein
MNESTTTAINVAGHARSLQEAMDIMVRYPRKTPMAFDLVGAGEPANLTAEEVRRTRKISSRISNNELAFFIETAETAPWIQSKADLADADPDSNGLFPTMTDLYWHFAERSPKGVNFAKISKVLHLKQPSLYPILDSHVRRAYNPAAKALRSEYPEFGWRRRTWTAIRNDLLDARATVRSLH